MDRHTQSRRRPSTKGLASFVVCVLPVIVIAACTGPERTDGPSTPSSAHAIPSQDTATSAAPPPAQSPSPEPEPEPSTFPVAASVTIAFLSTDLTSATAGGLVTGVSEDGGSCTYTFSSSESDTAPIEADTVGFANVDNTSCATVDVRLPAAGDAEWFVTLTYTSSTSSATSAPTRVEQQ